ncbi:N-acetyltransferase family protein [Exiguobacterium sp.]|uniref:GNAT family N-acetyltransferase n=1 Tax=Exiguobacterium sp. TaxID=44751 RepID=UPI00391CDC6A
MEIRHVTEEDARAIQAWTYEAPYHLYNQAPSDDGIDELMTYEGIYDGTELIGFFCLGAYAQVPNETYVYDETRTDIGLGMRPDHTGRGLGRTFFAIVVKEAKRAGKPLRLTVAAFNLRAIHLYEQFGFRRIASFQKADTEFVVMAD